jgi:hypothetical protein
MEIGTLAVTVLEARGLVEPQGTPYGINPRVVLTYDGVSQHTSQVSGQRNPQWGHDAHGTMTGQGEAFIFSVHDKSFERPFVAQIYTGSTLLGYAEVHLHEKGVELGKHRDDWFAVMRPSPNRPGAGERITGSDLRLILEYTPQRARHRGAHFVRGGGAEVEDIHASVRKQKQHALLPSHTKADAEFPTPTQEHYHIQTQLREELFEGLKRTFFDEYRQMLEEGTAAGAHVGALAHTGELPPGMALLRVSVLCGRDVLPGKHRRAVPLGSNSYVRVLYRPDWGSQHDLFIGQTNTEYRNAMPLYGKNQNPPPHSSPSLAFKSGPTSRLEQWPLPPQEQGEIEAALQQQLNAVGAAAQPAAAAAGTALSSALAATAATLCATARSNAFHVVISPPHEMSMDGLSPAQAMPWTKSSGWLVFEVWDEPDDDTTTRHGAQPQCIGEAVVKIQQLLDKESVPGGGDMPHLVVWEPCLQRGSATKGTGAQLLVRAQLTLAKASGALVAHSVPVSEAAAEARMEEVAEKLELLRPRELHTESWRRKKEKEWLAFCHTKSAGASDALPYVRPMPGAEGVRPWFVECDEVFTRIREVKDRCLEDISNHRRALSEHSLTSADIQRQVDASFHADYLRWCKSRTVATVTMTLVEALDLEIPEAKNPSNRHRTNLSESAKSQPYTKVLVHGREVWRSQYTKADRNPQWNETFKIAVTVSDGVMSPKRIQVQLWDHDDSGFDEFLGECFVELAHVQRGVWLPSHDPLPDTFGAPGLRGNAEPPKCVLSKVIPLDPLYGDARKAEQGVGVQEVSYQQRELIVQEERLKQAAANARAFDDPFAHLPAGDRARANAPVAHRSASATVFHTPLYASDPYNNHGKANYNPEKDVRVSRKGQGALILQLGSKTVQGVGTNFMALKPGSLLLCATGDMAVEPVEIEWPVKSATKLKLKLPWRYDTPRPELRYDYQIVCILPRNFWGHVGDKLPTGRSGELETVKCLRVPGPNPSKGGTQYLAGQGEGRWDPVRPEETQVDGWYNLRPMLNQVSDEFLPPAVRGTVRLHCTYTPLKQANGKVSAANAVAIGGDGGNSTSEEERQLLQRNPALKHLFLQMVPTSLTAQHFWALYRVKKVRDSVLGQLLSTLQAKRDIVRQQDRLLEQVQHTFEETYGRFVAKVDENPFDENPFGKRSLKIADLNVCVVEAQDLLPKTSDNAMRLFTGRFVRVRVMPEVLSEVYETNPIGRSDEDNAGEDPDVDVSNPHFTGDDDDWKSESLFAVFDKSNMLRLEVIDRTKKLENVAVDELKTLVNRDGRKQSGPVTRLEEKYLVEEVCVGVVTVSYGELLRCIEQQLKHSRALHSKSDWVDIKQWFSVGSDVTRRLMSSMQLTQRKLKQKPRGRIRLLIRVRQIQTDASRRKAQVGKQLEESGGAFGETLNLETAPEPLPAMGGALPSADKDSAVMQRLKVLERPVEPKPFSAVADKAHKSRDALHAMIDHHAAFARSVKNIFHHDYVELVQRHGVPNDAGSLRDFQRYAARSAILSVQVCGVRNLGAASAPAPFARISTGAGVKNVTPTSSAGRGSTQRVKIMTARATLVAEDDQGGDVWSWANSAVDENGELFNFDVSDVRFGSVGLALFRPGPREGAGAKEGDAFLGSVQVDVRGVRHVLDEETSQRHREELISARADAEHFEVINELQYAQLQRRIARLSASKEVSDMQEHVAAIEQKKHALQSIRDSLQHLPQQQVDVARLSRAGLAHLLEQVQQIDSELELLGVAIRLPVEKGVGSDPAPHRLASEAEQQIHALRQVRSLRSKEERFTQQFGAHVARWLHTQVGVLARHEQSFGSAEEVEHVAKSVDGTIGTQSLTLDQWYPLNGTKDHHGSCGEVRVKVRLALKDQVEPHDAQEFVPHQDMLRMLHVTRKSFAAMEQQLRDAAAARDEELRQLVWLKRNHSIRLRNAARAKVRNLSRAWKQQPDKWRRMLQRSELHKDHVTGQLEPLGLLLQELQSVSADVKARNRLRRQGEKPAAPYHTLTEEEEDIFLHAAEDLPTWYGELDLLRSAVATLEPEDELLPPGEMGREDLRWQLENDLYQVRLKTRQALQDNADIRRTLAEDYTAVPRLASLRNERHKQSVQYDYAPGLEDVDYAGSAQAPMASHPQPFSLRKKLSQGLERLARAQVSRHRGARAQAAQARGGATATPMPDTDA